MKLYAFMMRKISSEKNPALRKYSVCISNEMLTSHSTAVLPGWEMFVPCLLLIVNTGAVGGGGGPSPLASLLVLTPARVPESTTEEDSALRPDPERCVTAAPPYSHSVHGCFPSGGGTSPKTLQGKNCNPVHDAE